jgi:hypothetical protein
MSEKLWQGSFYSLLELFVKYHNFQGVPSVSFPKFGNKIKSQDENNKYGKKGD